MCMISQPLLFACDHCSLGQAVACCYQDTLSAHACMYHTAAASTPHQLAAAAAACDHHAVSPLQQLCQLAAACLEVGVGGVGSDAKVKAQVALQQQLPHHGLVLISTGRQRGQWGQWGQPVRCKGSQGQWVQWVQWVQWGGALHL